MCVVCACVREGRGGGEEEGGEGTRTVDVVPCSCSAALTEMSCLQRNNYSYE